MTELGSAIQELERSTAAMEGADLTDLTVVSRLMEDREIAIERLVSIGLLKSRAGELARIEAALEQGQAVLARLGAARREIARESNRVGAISAYGRGM